MAKIKPFKGLRPPKDLVTKVVARPYDVLNSAEARAEAAGNEMSLYRITRPEIDFAPDIDEHDECVYERAASNFKLFQDNGWLIQDKEDRYYIYAQTMGDHKQYGLVVATNVDDYMQGHIKKHELTRRDKEEDRMKHVRATNANIEPVFLAYPDNRILDDIVSKETAKAPEYDFVSNDGFGHTFWVIDDAETIKLITKTFESIPNLYIADGHHRTAAAALVGHEMAQNNPKHTGTEEYNYFLAVCFPESHLKIIDYNRVVKDLNGLTPESFIERLSEHFDIEAKGQEPYKPQRIHNFSIYLDNKWYSITAKKDTYDDNDPIEGLDVTISSKYILKDILGIGDLRSDKRIDFVGGIRGLSELEKRVDSGEMSIAIALYPVTMVEIHDDFPPFLFTSHQIAFQQSKNELIHFL